MDWIQGVQRAVDYVEAHITEPIDYEEAAKQAYSSSFHFQRVFSILCGFTLGDYIRMRRLSLAGTSLRRQVSACLTPPSNMGMTRRKVSAALSPGFTGSRPPRRSTQGRRSNPFPLFP